MISKFYFVAAILFMIFAITNLVRGNYLYMILDLVVVVLLFIKSIYKEKFSIINYFRRKNDRNDRNR